MRNEKMKKSYLLGWLLSIVKPPGKRFKKYFLGLGLTTIFAVTVGGLTIGRTQSILSHGLQLLQQGKQLYEAGSFFEAAALWEKAAKEYETQGDFINLALSLNYLASAYQELGEWERSRIAIEKSIKLLEKQKNDSKGLGILAQSLNNMGSLQLAIGHTEAALETWRKAEITYAQALNEIGKLGSQINQAQALQALGQYRRAKNLLESLVEKIKTQPDTPLKAMGLRSLGEVLHKIGELIQAKEILEQSWEISARIGNSAETSATLLSIGNIARDLQQYEVARAYYQQAAKMAQNDFARLPAQLNQLSLLVENEKREEALALGRQIKTTLSKLPSSRAAIFAKVNFVESLTKIKGYESEIGGEEIAKIIAGAVQESRQLKDARAEALAVNKLGNIYERNQQWEEAKTLTNQALQIAQKIDAPDLIARSAWQLGRIRKQQGDIQAAIAAYTEAFEAFQSLRSDLAAISSDIQFNFKESVEPFHREMVSILLQPNASQANIIKAREVIEALQLAELDNFFRDACLQTHPVQIDQIDPQAAVIYPIILSDRLEVIISAPNRPLRHYATALPSWEIENILQKLYSSLYLGYSGTERLRLSQQVYNWLIQPAEAELAASNIKTLVFVLDGFLRSLPMAALYDGEKYLIEKYNIALSPGLQLFPEGLQRSKLEVLAAGLTEARAGFSALPGVETEIKQISSKFKAKVLLNENFTRASFKSQIEKGSPQVVHLATHGQFSSNPEETFLLTWDGQFGVKDFERVLETRQRFHRNPIELLVLSACETAAGDRRAALGLAGFALRSGARSTIATLWSVNDESTAALMAEFYQRLTQSNVSMTKAQALREAQLTLLKNPDYNHPYFWAPFVLVGNWL
ncbi:MAG: CHAT domain-containing protein [Oscillatoriaceae bacterium SKW80]|nr:CHAT domain-containing protein [Oscillatoriaceae bacterium SKYG93]MCX8121001.1 CHAT domain-containing protein [Oscillatoriaceae bacterium SKW80]MDW8452274.1 CHAT domain-containing protein [Oscillatoriaceae cyanobacterium SKYGB_i_bin93]